MNSCACAAYCARSPLRTARAISLIMAERIPENLQQKLSERLRFYEDISIQLFYRDRGAGERVQSLAATVSRAGMQKGETALAKTAPEYEPRKLAPVAPQTTHMLPVLTAPSLFDPPHKIP